MEPFGGREWSLECISDLSRRSLNSHCLASRSVALTIRIDGAEGLPYSTREAAMAWAISFKIMMTLILTSCGEMSATKMREGNTVQTQERPDATSVVAPAARDVDSKGGVPQQR